MAYRAAEGAGDIDFLKRRVVLHRNAVAVNKRTAVGTLKSGKNQTVALATFVVDELAKSCEGRELDELIWPSRSGGISLRRQRTIPGWPARSRGVRKPTRDFRGSLRTRSVTLRPR